MITTMPHQRKYFAFLFFTVPIKRAMTDITTKNPKSKRSAKYRVSGITSHLTFCKNILPPPNFYDITLFCIPKINMKEIMNTDNSILIANIHFPLLP